MNEPSPLTDASPPKTAAAPASETTAAGSSAAASVPPPLPNAPPTSAATPPIEPEPATAQNGPPPPPVPPSAVVAAASGAAVEALASLRGELSVLRESSNAVAERLSGAETLLESITKQLGFLPPQLRALSGKVDSLATDVSEARYRGLLLSLLSVHDLVDQLLRADPAAVRVPTDADHRRNYGVLRTQLRQILEANGFSEIPADGPFNPELHRAMQSVPCERPEDSDRVAGVLRPGFRTAARVLRYAEVSVTRYSPPAEETAPPDGAPASPTLSRSPGDQTQPLPQTPGESTP